MPTAAPPYPQDPDNHDDDNDRDAHAAEQDTRRTDDDRDPATDGPDSIQEGTTTDTQEDTGADTPPDTDADSRRARVVDLATRRLANRTPAPPDTGADTAPDTQADTEPDNPEDTGADTASAAAVARVPRPRGAGDRKVLPWWTSSRDAFVGAVREYTRHAARVVAFHTLRIPTYWGRLARRSPRGTGKVIRWSWEWATDVNGRVARRTLAFGPGMGGSEGHAFHRISEQHKERVRFRLALAAVLLAAMVIGVWQAWVRLPLWQPIAGTMVLPALLGALHRDATKPVLSSFEASNVSAPRLTMDLIAAALGSLGIAELNKGLKLGELQFVAPGVHRDGPGWRVDVNLPGGVTAGDVAERRDRLASGLRRPLSCVWPETDHDEHPGRLVLWVGDKPMHKTTPKPWPLATKGRVNLFESFPLGTDQRGRPQFLTLMFASMLIGAVPRMGKTFTLRLILLAAALDPTSELHVYDLKGGADLRPLGLAAHRFRSGYDTPDLQYVLDGLRAVTAEMSRRYKTLGTLSEWECPEGKVTPELAARRTLGLHALLVALDECHYLLDHPEYGPEAVALCTDLVKRGPAVGIIVILATQRPDAKSIPRDISANAVLRYCLKVTGQTENDMVLGTSAYKSGVRATMFARNDKGIGYLVGEGADPVIVRTTYLDAVQARAIAERARTMRQQAGTLSGHAAGIDDQPTEPEQAPTILDDLLAVMPAGEPRVWSDVLIERLAQYRPATYTGWAPVDLGNALAPFGVETVQIGKRIAGRFVNRRGVDRTHILTAITERDRARGE